MGRLEGRVAIVTGAGRGLGRAHALALAEGGASVVVNDKGASIGGEGSDLDPAESVVSEIRAKGGKAVASGHDVADWEEAGGLVRLAIETFGALHVLVNNAGILRDRTLANMSAEEWDAVIRVHLKGHAAPTHHALAYWRDRAKAGSPLKASVVHTTSAGAFTGTFGQSNYAAAKAAVLALSRVVDLEGARHGVRSNCVSPAARTRLSLESGKDAETLFQIRGADGFDPWNPANVSPLVAWLAEESCPASSQIFQVVGRRLFVLSLPPIVHTLENEGRWTPEALERALAGRLVEPLSDAAIFGEIE